MLTGGLGPVAPAAKRRREILGSPGTQPPTAGEGAWDRAGRAPFSAGFLASHLDGARPGLLGERTSSGPWAKVSVGSQPFEITPAHFPGSKPH